MRRLPRSDEIRTLPGDFRQSDSESADPNGTSDESQDNQQAHEREETDDGSGQKGTGSLHGD